jgi:hypothetical protein
LKWGLHGSIHLHEGTSGWEHRDAIRFDLVF